MPRVLHAEDENGDIKVMDTKIEVQQAARELTEKHMGKDRQRRYINKKNEMIPAFSQTRKGKTWREKLQQGTLTNKDWRIIPKHLRHVFRQARAVKNNKGEYMNANMYGDIFTALMTLGEMDAHIAKMKKNTAPGPSSIRIDHVAALPKDMREIVALAISLPYMRGLGYEQWKDELVNWIPKEEGNTDMNKRRPIMFYEVLRKLSVGIRVKKVLKVWSRNGIIDDDNYAFLTGRTTVQPLMIKKMMLEDAAYNDKTIAMVDIDFSKAYDSTEKFAKEMSLRRLGFPEEGLDMWQQYDSNRRMSINTAYGPTEPITPECGAWGQGAPESPIGWLSLMCWMSAVVDKEATEPYEHHTSKGIVKISKVIYADDGTYIARTRKGVQKIVTAVSDFASRTGTIIKPQKNYTYANHDGPPLKVRMFGQGGERSEYNLTEINETDFLQAPGKCTKCSRRVLSIRTSNVWWVYA